MRGEHVVGRIGIGGGGGPSPHARGTHERPASRQPFRRAIPACAGNTGASRVSGEMSAGHPRMRGEHAIICTGHSLQCGPSPHARGTQFRDAIPGPHQRAIPACAGNTCMQMQTGHSPAGHPRMRGEHKEIEPDIDYAPGPSPHARGTREASMHAGNHDRAIPACAGNTASYARPRFPVAGHPRMRGEHTLAVAGDLTAGGPSPHARGTRRPGRRR